jgi:Type IV secretion system pilin
MKKFPKIRHILLMFVLFVFPLLTRAGSAGGPAVPRLDNPLKVGTVPALLTEISNLIKELAVPFLAFMLIFTGYKFVMARGKDKEREAAIGMLKNVVIGGAIILGASLIATALKGTFDALSA